MSSRAISFSLKLLGGCSLEGPGGLVSGRAAQRRRFACLALIAVEGRRGASRDKLAALLWPEHNDERARHFLSDTLYVLRSTLGDRSLLTAGDRIALNPEVVVCDVLAFADALELGDAALAVAVYGGPFLDGFHVSKAPEFERWVDRERERLEDGYAGALEALAQEAERRGEAVEATAWWRRLATLRPYDGRVAGRLVEALEAAGNRAGAIQHVQLHAAILRQDLETEPDHALLELAERLRSAPSPPSPGHPHAPPGSPGPAPVAPRAPAPVPRDAGAAGDAFVPRRSPARPRARLGPIYLALGALMVLIGFTAYGWWTPTRRAASAEAVGAHAVAVLPFLNLSGSPENEYFSDGISEEILNALAKLPALRVAARTSSFSLKGRSVPVQEIGRMLDVTHVLEGSVQREAGRVRIRAQLIDARTGYHLWSERYDRDTRDIFAVEDEIARAVVNALRPALDTGPPAPWTTPDVEAYEAYLKGRYLWGLGDYRKAIEFFESALARDSGYAPAYAGLADAYARLADNQMLPREEAYPKAIAAARRAIDLDETLAEAHSALAHILTHEFELAEAEREYRRALELSPSYAPAHGYYAVHLLGTGRQAQAVQHARRALQLDPLGAETGFLGAAALRGSRHFGEAVAALRSRLELHPNHAALRQALGITYVEMGRYAEGISVLQLHTRLTGASRSRVWLARALALAGEKAAARDTLRAVLQAVPEDQLDSFAVAAALAALGDRDRAFAWLEKVAERESPTAQGLYGPPMDSLRADPRFERILERLGLPPYTGQ